MDVLAGDVLLPFRVDDPYIGSITYIDAKGRERASSTPARLEPVDPRRGLNKATFFKRAVANDEYYGPLDLGDVEFATSSGGGISSDCACEIQIAAADNYGDGVFLETYRIGSAFPEFIGNAAGGSGYAYALTAKAQPISYPNRKVFVRIRQDPALFKNLPQVQRALSSSGSGSTTGRSVAGERVLSAWATVEPVSDVFAVFDRATA